MSINWQKVVLPRAAEIVRGYQTGVTLRQLFYRLVAEELIPNTHYHYQHLSRTTARMRRDGDFPDLFDRTREIHRLATFSGPDDARAWLQQHYRRDRTEGQQWQVYIAVEKHGLVELVRSWFEDRGVPILSLGGYSSQTYVDDVARDFDGRPTVLLYAGDFDPSGIDIPRDFLERVGGFDHVRRVALTPEQVEKHDLPPQPGKEDDSRASQFVARHGRLIQVELDALPPDVLRGEFEAAMRDGFWDSGIFDQVLARENEERSEL